MQSDIKYGWRWMKGKIGTMSDSLPWIYILSMCFYVMFCIAHSNPYYKLWLHANVYSFSFQITDCNYPGAKHCWWIVTICNCNWQRKKRAAWKKRAIKNHSQIYRYSLQLRWKTEVRAGTSFGIEIIPKRPKGKAHTHTSKWKWRYRHCMSSLFEQYACG